MREVRNAIERAAEAIGWSKRVIVQTTVTGPFGCVTVNGKWLVEATAGHYRLSQGGDGYARSQTPDGIATATMLAMVRDTLAQRLKTVAPVAAAEGGDG